LNNSEENIELIKSELREAKMPDNYQQGDEINMIDEVERQKIIGLKNKHDEVKAKLSEAIKERDSAICEVININNKDHVMVQKCLVSIGFTDITDQNSIQQDELYTKLADINFQDIRVKIGGIATTRKPRCKKGDEKAIENKHLLNQMNKILQHVYGKKIVKCTSRNERDRYMISKKL